jgi:hypothetical protein
LTRDMEGEESIVAQVERFEDCCSRKRHLEGDIELVLARRDETATEVVELAERELETTKRECAEIEARVERAHQLDLGRAENPSTPSERGYQDSPDATKEGRVVPQANGSNTRPASASSGQSVQLPAIIDFSSPMSPSVLSSLPTSTADSDNFSLVSDPRQGAAGPSTDHESNSDPPDHSEDDLSDEFVTLLVQRYSDICHERRTLQEEIEGKLERKVRLAAEKLRSATIALETTRQKAVEIVAALNEASGGDTKIKPPAGPIGTIDPNTIRSAADGTHASSSVPIAITSTVPLVTGPDPVQARESSIPTPIVTVAPLPSSIASVTPALGDIRTTPMNHPPEPTLRHNPATAIPPTTASSSQAPTITATQWAIYTKYDQMMVTAKAAGGSISMLNVPWPLLMQHLHQYPVQNATAQLLEDSSVTSFFQGYIQWKGWNLRVEGGSVLADWDHLNSRVPERKTGGKACVKKVVSILRKLVQN